MIQTFDIATDQGVVRIERNLAEINVEGPVADERWRLTDSAGHQHTYSEERADRERGGHYPTLEYVPGPLYYCGECRDEHEDYAVSHYECRQCREVIQPGSREARNPEAMVLTSLAAYLDGEPITRERAEALLSEAATAQAQDGSVHQVRLSP